MKIYLILLSSALMLLVGCTQEPGIGKDGDGELVKANFTANLEAVATKAVADNDGMGAKATRCIMELYYGDELYYRDVQSVNEKVAKFENVTLVSSRTYEVLFWADADAGYYNASDLKSVKMTGTGYEANKDERDAFFYRGEQKVEQQGASYSVELCRPFAQMNVITLDASAIKSESLYPETVEMVYTAPTEFNVYTGELGGEKELTVRGPVYATFDAAKPALTLEMDYLFAPLDKAMLDIAFRASHTGEEDVVYAFTNIPYQRNYRTNIQGKLLTTTGSWTATIVPIWDGDGTDVEADPYLINYTEAGSIADANEKLEAGENAVSIENPDDTDTNSITLPASQDGNDIFLKLSGTEGKTVKVVLGDGAQGPANLYVTADKGSLDINCPDSHVEVNGGEYETITASTSASTLVIAAGVKVNKLTATKGAVVVNGLVAELSSNTTAEINISTAEGLMAYAAAFRKYSNHNTNIVADIDMSGYEWVPMEAINSTIQTFDGQNHVISNLTATEYTGSYSGLFGSSTFDIKNVTVKDVVLTYPSSVEDQARGGVISGVLYSGSITNCHVDGATIKASQKIGGLIGYIDADSSKDITVSDCSVKNVTVSSNFEDLVYQAAGIVGYIQQEKVINVTIKNCSVKNFVVNGGYNGLDNAPYHCHAFVGNINAKKEGTVVALVNNTVDQQLNVERTVYTSDYFGWAGNPERSADYKAVITIDGQAWTPNYPFKNVTTGKGYATLDEAFTALQQDETLEIWQAGEYAVQTLSTPANSTVDAKVDGVVFNHTAAASSWIASDAISGRTVKNITWNIGNANYQALHVDNLIGCTINGRFYPHVAATFTDCVFNAPGYDYCLWTWNSDATFKSCKFNTSGKAVNVYGAEDHTYVFEDCIFNATNIPANKGKAAIFVKDGVDTDNQNAKVNVVIKNCTANYERPYNQLDSDPQLSESVLWNVEIGQYANTNEITVSVDDEKVYPFTKFKVSDAAGLRNAVEMFNNSKQAVEHTIIVNDGTYEVSGLLIRKNLSGKSLVMKAANPKGATFKVKAGGESPYIFIFDGCSSYDETRTTSFEGINFDLSAISSETAVAQSISGDNTRYGYGIIFDGCDLTGGESMNLNAMFFISSGNTSPRNVVIKNCSIANVGYLTSSYVDGFVAENVTTATAVKHFINNQTSGVTVKDCNVNCNTDYAVRSNGGPVSITGSTFVMTYAGSDKGGVYVDRGKDTQLTMTGNTYPATYVSASMHDVYNEKNGDCILNGSIIITNGNSYDFPRE